MKTLFKLLSACCLLGASLVSCVPEPLDIEIPQEDPKTVVFSQVIPNQIMIVGLTKSFAALDFNEDNGDTLTDEDLNQLLEDSATVTISYQNVTDTLFRIEKGLYASINTPQFVNETYALRIINDAGEIVTAESKMLEQATFTSITPFIERTKDTTAFIELSFSDLADQNWYMINFYNKAPAGFDVNSIFNTGENNLLKTVLIYDQTFEDTYSEKLNLSELGISPTDTIAVTLSNISEQYFNFLSLRKRSGNIFTEVTNEPISYPTNVENGYGFFNTHYPDIRIFDLNQY